MKTKLIGLCGYAGAGKDATAALLRMVGYQRVAFADQVREEVRHFLEDNKENLGPAPLEMWRLLKEIVDTREVDVKPTSSRMRKILQLWGSEFRRAQDPEYWTKAAHRKIQDILLRGEGVVVSDVRFPNEVALVEDLGGVIWKVVRPGLTSDGHVSEDGVDKIIPSLTLENSGTLLDLAEKVQGELWD